MAYVMNPKHMDQRRGTYKSGTQKVCIGMGIVFILIGLVGIMMPGFMGMHLSMAHDLIHLASGALALWAGSTTDQRAFNFCLIFGGVYGLLGVVGFIIGEPGYPGVGHMHADQNLFRLVPNVLEFGTVDHVVHLAISGIFLITAYVWRRDRPGKQSRARPTIGKRETTFTADINRSSTETPKDIDIRSTLGTSEMETRSDVERRL
jgi:hypothetical protein